MKVGRKKNWEEGGTRELEEKKGFLSSFLIVFLILNNAKKKKKEICVSDIPANCYCHGLRGGGTGTDNLRFQPVGLKHVQEGITGRHRPWTTRDSTYNTSFVLFYKASFYKARGS